MSPEVSRLCWRGAGNAWECDENEHLNVRFYVRCFEQAAAYLRLEAGADDAPSLLRSMTVRFHRELRAGDTVSVWGARLDPAAGLAPADSVFHLVNDGDGTLSATCVAALGEARLERLPAVPPDEAARPRSFGPGSTPWVGGRRSWAELESDHAVPVARGFVEPNEVDAQDRWTFYGMTGRASDGVGHLWAALGYPRREMLDRDLGGVVLEQRTVWYAPLRRGAPFRMLSSLREVIRGKLLRFGHASFDARTGALVYASDAIVSRFDQKTRRVAPLAPEEVTALTARSAAADGCVP